MQIYHSAWSSFLLFLSVVDITGENLEDLLTYDDLFLDYFNKFLALPVSTNMPMMIHEYPVQTQTTGPFHEWFFHCSSNSMENWF